jgi:hypothetical protein
VSSFGEQLSEKPIVYDIFPDEVLSVSAYGRDVFRSWA